MSAATARNGKGHEAAPPIDRTERDGRRWGIITVNSHSGTARLCAKARDLRGSGGFQVFGGALVFAAVGVAIAECLVCDVTPDGLDRGVGWKAVEWTLTAAFALELVVFMLADASALDGGNESATPSNQVHPVSELQEELPRTTTRPSPAASLSFLWRKNATTELDLLRWARQIYPALSLIVVVLMLTPARGASVLVLMNLRVPLELRAVAPAAAPVFGVVAKSLPSVGYISVMLVLFVFVFSVAGTQLFGDNDPVHFGTFTMSVLTCIRLTTLDSWVPVWYTQAFGCDVFGYGSYPEDCVTPEARPVVAAIYFVLFVLSMFVMLALFVGMVVGSMADINRTIDAEKRKKTETRIEKKAAAGAWTHQVVTPENHAIVDVFAHRAMAHNQVIDRRASLGNQSDHNGDAASAASGQTAARMGTVDDVIREEVGEIPSQVDHAGAVPSRTPMQELTRVCVMVSAHPAFTAMAVAAILLAGVISALDASDSHSRSEERALAALEVVTLVVFTVEIAVRLFASWGNLRGFFSQAWNVIDFTIVLLSYIPFISVQYIRLLRLLRLMMILQKLRPLRIILLGLADVANVAGYLGLLLYVHVSIFSVTGLELFGHSDPWFFGTLGRSFMVQISVLTMYWVDAMYVSMRGCDDRLMPTQYSYPADICHEPNEGGVPAALFFIAALLFGALASMNLLVGAVTTGMQEAALQLGEETRREKELNRLRQSLNLSPSDTARLSRTFALISGGGRIASVARVQLVLQAFGTFMPSKKVEEWMGVMSNIDGSPADGMDLPTFMHIFFASPTASMRHEVENKMKASRSRKSSSRPSISRDPGVPVPRNSVASDEAIVGDDTEDLVAPMEEPAAVAAWEDPLVAVLQTLAGDGPLGAGESQRLLSALSPEASLSAACLALSDTSSRLAKLRLHFSFVKLHPPLQFVLAKAYGRSMLVAAEMERVDRLKVRRAELRALVVFKMWTVAEGAGGDLPCRVFQHLFEANPDYMKLFAVLDGHKSLGDAVEDTIFNRHAARAMQAVGSMIMEAHGESEEVFAQVASLAAKHYRYGVRPYHIEAFEAAFLSALEGRFGGLFTPVVRSAWRSSLARFLSLVQEGIDRAANEAERTTDREVTVTEQHFNLRRRLLTIAEEYKIAQVDITALRGIVNSDSAMEDEEKEGHAALLLLHRMRSDELQLQMIKASWGLVSLDLEIHATNMFIEIFEKNPTVMPLFGVPADAHPAESAKSRRMRRHAVRVLQAVGQLVSGLPHSIDSRALPTLGASHVKYGALPEHLPAVKAALVVTLRDALGDAWVPGLARKWSDTYDAVAAAMTIGMRRALREREEATTMKKTPSKTSRTSSLTR